MFYLLFQKITKKYSLREGFGEEKPTINLLKDSAEQITQTLTPIIQEFLESEPYQYLITAFGLDSALVAKTTSEKVIERRAKDSDLNLFFEYDLGKSLLASLPEVTRDNCESFFDKLPEDLKKHFRNEKYYYETQESYIHINPDGSEHGVREKGQTTFIRRQISYLAAKISDSVSCVE